MTDKDKFEELVRSYVELDDQIKQASKDMKTLKDKKKELDGTITDYMKLNNIETVNITGGKLKVYTSKVKTPINKEHIFDVLASKLDEKKATDITDYIMENRQTEEKEVLKRTK